ncbi:MAG TPA: hypothetical protein VGP72_15520 [Planctomycetota bacterium]|jgi:hypothetical protein
MSKNPRGLQEEKLALDKAKLDLEKAKLDSSTALKAKFLDIVALALRYGFTVLAIWFIVDGFKLYRTDQLRALKEVISAFKLDSLFGWGGCGIFGTAWYYERWGKKRAIKKKGEFQALAEGKDTYRSSSGLTKTGDTPSTGGH